MTENVDLMLALRKRIDELRAEREARAALPMNQRVDFGSVRRSCSCQSSFDGEGDGSCPIHRE